MSNVKPLPFPKNLKWNLGNRQAKAINKGNAWYVRIRWSDNLGLEFSGANFDKEPRNLVKNINKAGRIDVDAHWSKVTGRDLDESFMEHGWSF